MSYQLRTVCVSDAMSDHVVIEAVLRLTNGCMGSPALLVLYRRQTSDVGSSR